MGKEGPCYHCGVTSTPLWRNGPPEKPVLCNACGSRWRTKGTLLNYTPLHSRADENEDHHKFQRLKSISVNNKNKDTKILKRKAIQDNIFIKRPFLEFNNGLKKAVAEEDTSNRSSSGSALSNSESYAQFSTADESELTGPSQSNAWDSTVPCKRRTDFVRPQSSSVEKLRKDLYNLLQEQQSSYLSVSSEEELLFENEMSMVSVEIGHGSVLMKNPHSLAREEESEASSLSSVENRSSSISKAYSQAIKQEQLTRTKSQTGRDHVLGSHNSPLCSIDLKEVFNFNVFTEHFTEEQQKSLMKFLPQIDSFNLLDSVRMMFESVQFKENFSLFQNLISDGVFDIPSSSVAKLDDIKTLKKLALSDFNKSHLMESYKLLKEGEKKTGDSVTTTSRSLNSNVPNHIVTINRQIENQTQLKSETRGLMRSPKYVMKMKSSHEKKVMTENDVVSCFSPRSLASVFAQEGGSAVFGYEGGCSSEQDLLIDLPYKESFPQAELLHQI